MSGGVLRSQVLGGWASAGWVKQGPQAPSPSVAGELRRDPGHRPAKPTFQAPPASLEEAKHSCSKAEDRVGFC